MSKWLKKMWYFHILHLDSIQKNKVCKAWNEFQVAWIWKVSQLKQKTFSVEGEYIWIVWKSKMAECSTLRGQEWCVFSWTNISTMSRENLQERQRNKIDCLWVFPDIIFCWIWTETCLLVFCLSFVWWNKHILMKMREIQRMLFFIHISDIWTYVISSVCPAGRLDSCMDGQLASWLT